MIEKLQRIADIIGNLPQGTFASAEIKHQNNEDKFKIAIQARTQREARAMRQIVGIRLWQKRHSEKCNWWELIGITNGIEVQIYAITEAPPTCKLVEETYTEVQDVPVEFEQRLMDVPVRYEQQEIVRTRQVWQCQ